MGRGGESRIREVVSHCLRVYSRFRGADGLWADLLLLLPLLPPLETEEIPRRHRTKRTPQTVKSHGQGARNAEKITPLSFPEIG